MFKIGDIVRWINPFNVTDNLIAVVDYVGQDECTVAWMNISGVGFIDKKHLTYYCAGLEEG